MIYDASMMGDKGQGILGVIIFVREELGEDL